MFEFVRYPLWGCLALLLVACGSSGSQTLLGSGSSNGDGNGNGNNSNSEFSDKHLLRTQESFTAARKKFAIEDDEENSAKAPSLTGAQLNIKRLGIIRAANRFLSTGVLVVKEKTAAEATSRTFFPPNKVDTTSACEDGARATSANCVFKADDFRDQVTHHLGTKTSGENNVGYLSSSLTRQSVMDYRGVMMSQVRSEGTDVKTTGTGESKKEEQNKYEYTGYDGMLTHSMFFVGVYKFFDEATDESEKKYTHLRFDHASIGQIYDQDSATPAEAQNPNLDLTGIGVMAGMEVKQRSRDYHLVQGDVNINYTHTDAHVDITIQNVKRLVDDGEAWYADATRTGQLQWTDLDVVGSKFEDGKGTSKEILGSFYGTPSTATGEDPDNGVYEIGGVFRHSEAQHETEDRYSIIGSFGSKLKSSDDE